MPEPSGGAPKKTPFAAIDRIASSALRGRGGGWFPAWRKWQAVLAEDGDALVVANGAEGEPGSIKDRFILLTRFKDVCDGILAAAKAIGAREAVVYLKGSFVALEANLVKQLERIDTAGVAITVRRGDDSYVGGEETAVSEWLSGNKAWPRAKPPLPSAAGVSGRPTLVQNVETLSYVPRALADPEAFINEESTLVSLWGHVKRPGVYDVPLGTKLRELIEDWGGGATGVVVAVFPGGPSAAPLDANDLDTPLEPEALRERGSSLGTASVLVVCEQACPLSVVSSAADFFARESCGQCPPCSVGATNMAALIARLEAGTVRASEIANVHEIAGFMRGHGYCAHGRTDAALVTGALARFAALVTRHLDAGSCPIAATPFRPFDKDSPEQRAIEAVLETYLPRASGADKV